ncbi:hypothetical protein ACHAW5_000476 [Stephanodiscus triporus]|uniref:sn-1-specific diacylglycerol lipase n=1 Tax=Stephanodiscus triporus TaxID=2934178 RepID=A0ABD3NAG2_9STRA
MIPPPPVSPHFYLLAATALRAAAVGGGGASSFLLVRALVRGWWERATPEWMRDVVGDGDGDGEGSSNGPASTDEMSSLSDVMRKLEGLVATGYDRLGSDARAGRRRRVVSRFRALAEASSRGGASTSTSTRGSIEHDSRGRRRDCDCDCDCDRDDYDEHENDAGRRRRDNNISPLEWHAALLVYWQLCNQIRARHPMWRDEIYRSRDDRRSIWRRHATSENCRSNADVRDRHRCINGGNDNGDGECDDDDTSSRCDDVITPSQIEELRTMLEHAIWAYEPNEESLRSYLLSSGNSSGDGGKGRGNVESNGRGDIEGDGETSGGYHLILHRTTEFVDYDDDGINDAKKGDRNRKRRKPPGRVGYFVAVSHVERTVLIGMKGTSTFEEILTDCCGRAVRVDLEDDPHRGGSGSVRSCSDDATTPNDQVAAGVDRIRNDNEEGNGAAIVKDGVGYSEDEYDGEELVDVVRLCYAANSNCSGDVSLNDSVEVELASDGYCNHHRRQRNSSSNDSDAHSYAAVVISASSGIDDLEYDVRSGEAKPPGGTAPTMRGDIDDVPSIDNVLLFPSSSTVNPSRARNINRQSTDEYMESHCVETEVNRSHKLRGVHEGILHCARVLLHEISPLIEEYAVTGGYDVVCTGHSLGAGAAVLLAVLLRGRYPKLATTRAETQTRPSRVRAYAFGPPPILDRISCLACRHYVTSVVNNSDIISRSSLTNLDAFLTILEAVRSRLLEGGVNPLGQMNSIASIIALFRKLCEGTEGELVLSPTELRMLWDEAIAEASLGDGENDKFYWDEEFGHHLFVPGRLLLMYESWMEQRSR